jgi:hypothetical protein
MIFMVGPSSTYSSSCTYNNTSGFSVYYSSCDNGTGDPYDTSSIWYGNQPPARNFTEEVVIPAEPRHLVDNTLNERARQICAAKAHTRIFLGGDKIPVPAAPVSPALLFVPEKPRAWLAMIRT